MASYFNGWLENSISVGRVGMFSYFLSWGFLKKSHEEEGYPPLGENLLNVNGMVSHQNLLIYYFLVFDMPI